MDEQQRSVLSENTIIALNVKATLLREQENWQKLVEMLKSECPCLWDMLPKTQDESDLLGHLGTALYELQDLEMAATCHKRALEFFERSNDLEGVCIATNELAMINMDWGQYDEAVTLYEKSLKLDVQLERESTATLQNLSILYQYKKDYDKALEYSEGVVRIDRTARDRSPRPATTNGTTRDTGRDPRGTGRRAMVDLCRGRARHRGTLPIRTRRRRCAGGTRACRASRNTDR